LFRQILVSLLLLLRAAGAETLAAQDSSAARRLKGHRVRLAALVANNLETLAFAAASGTAEIGAARVPAILATLGLAQVALSVIFLFTFREGERLAAFGAGDLNVWHGLFSPSRKRGLSIATLSFSSAPALRDPTRWMTRHANPATQL
jgi:hypothetical protein